MTENQVERLIGALHRISDLLAEQDTTLKRIADKLTKDPRHPLS